MADIEITTKTGGHKQMPLWKHAPFWHIIALMAACSLFYYLDVIIDFWGLMNLRWGIFYTVHDLHRSLFLIPTMYATYKFGLKGIIVTSLISFLVFLPRALVISPYPDPLIRVLIFMISMVIMGVLLSKLLIDISERRKLEQSLSQVQDTLLRKGAEESKRESEERLRYALEITHIGAWDLDLIDHSAFRSIEHDRIFGYAELLPEWTYDMFLDHVLAEDRPMVENKYRQAIDNQTDWNFECRILRTDGQTRWIWAAGHHKLGPDGTTRRMAGIVQDITERKRLVQVLEQSQYFLNLIIENTPNPMWISDKDGTVIIINEALRNLLKITDKEIIGIYNVQKDLQVEQQGFLPLVKSVFTEGKTVEFTIEYNTGKEKQVNLQTTAALIIDIIITPIINTQGKVINAIAQHKDVTEHRKAEEEILKLNAELEQKVAQRTMDLHNSQLALLNIVEDLNTSNKKVSVINQTLDATNKELASFSYSVSHDLRAPLRSIDGFSQALLEDYQNKLDDTGRTYINKVRAAAQHMGLLIDDMLKLSRISHAEFYHESIDLSEIVRSIAEALKKDNPDRDIKITIQKGIVVKGDHNAMRIALTNLLENAWKFTGKTTNARIEFGMLQKDDKPVMFIRDNGAGFDMSYVDKLFGAFQRLHTKDEFTGTGIGLATVKRIITRHGGEIWAEGEVGKGAVFYFTLPE